MDYLNCIIFGDFNIDLLQKSESVDKYYAKIAQNGFTQRLDFPTGVTGTTTLLKNHVVFNKRAFFSLSIILKFQALSIIMQL